MLFDRLSIAARRACALVLALCLLAALPCGGALAASSKELTVSFSVTTYQNRARAALADINALRKQKGLAPLILSADLEKAAIQRAAELFVFFDHVRPDLSDYDTVDDEYKVVNEPLAVAECIAAGYDSADDLMADWSASSTDSLLDADFTHAGLGCVFVKGSYNEYYWALYLQQLPEGASPREADASAKAGAKRNVKVKIDKGMYARADESHKRFELRASNLNLKSKKTATASVYLYDRYDVKIGKCDAEGLTFRSSNTAVFTVTQDGTVKRQKVGTGTLTIKAPGLDDAKATVTVGSGASASSGGSASAVTAATIGDSRPAFAATQYSAHTSLSAYLKGASGYVLYRATSRSGNYAKVDEKATTSRWTLKLLHEDLSRAYYYKVRAYKNSGGKRVYSEYSAAVKVEP